MIRLLPWFMLLHHIPGECAPGEAGDEQGAAGAHEHGSDGRVREHLLGGAGNVVTGVRERMIAALEHEPSGRAQVLAWAAREAIGTAPMATDFLRATVDEDTASRRAQDTQKYSLVLRLWRFAPGSEGIRPNIQLMRGVAMTHVQKDPPATGRQDRSG